MRRILRLGTCHSAPWIRCLTAVQRIRGCLTRLGISCLGKPGAGLLEKLSGCSVLRKIRRRWAGCLLLFVDLRLQWAWQVGLLLRWVDTWGPESPQMGLSFLPPMYLHML